MQATKTNWNEAPKDDPIPLLSRRMVKGDKMLIAEIRLAKGCHVARHHHDSEQIAIHISGRVRWQVGEPGSPEYREEILRGGDVMVLPSNVPHAVDALEDTLIFDALSPIGPMGVDQQAKTSS